MLLHGGTLFMFLLGVDFELEEVVFEYFVGGDALARLHTQHLVEQAQELLVPNHLVTRIVIAFL